jgi:hypothetical protein
MARAPDLGDVAATSFALFAFFAVPFPCFECDTPRAMILAGKRSGETVRYGQCIGK